MPCNLTFWGKDFDADAFVAQTGLAGYSISRKGEPVYRTKSDGRKFDVSSCTIEVSGAEFNAFNQQVSDVTAYLTEHSGVLTHIPTAEGLEDAFLDFGVSFNPPNGFYQSQRLPPELVKLAAAVNISITISIYPLSQEE